jgi:hypothetical protein
MWDVKLQAGEVGWLDAQEHAGHNIGDSGSHAIFVELKEPAPSSGAGPTDRLDPVLPESGPEVRRACSELQT